VEFGHGRRSLPDPPLERVYHVVTASFETVGAAYGNRRFPWAPPRLAPQAVSWLQVSGLAIVLIVRFALPTFLFVVVSFFDYDRTGIYPAFILNNQSPSSAQLRSQPSSALRRSPCGSLRGFRRRFRGSGFLFYLAVASLVMPSLLVGFGIGLGFKVLGLKADLFTSLLGAQLTGTLPFGLFAMFAVVSRFDRSYEEATSDLGASAWQRLRHMTLPILLPGIISVAMGAFTLSYDEYARTTLAIGNRNTPPLEIYALISSATSPTLFAIGTVRTTVSFCAIGVTLLVIFRLQRRRKVGDRAAPAEGF
jgi:ABC-type Fe3+ transport system permease subunit